MLESVYRVHILLEGRRVGRFEASPHLRLRGDGKAFSTRATQRVRVQDGLIVSARLTYDRDQLTGASVTTPPPPACPACAEPNVVVAWTRMHERGLFCPICEHSWVRNVE